MYNQIREDILFCMFYAGVAAMSVIACCYLLFRRGNAFAPDITTPARLRRWTAILFAAFAFSHAWYMPILSYTAPKDIMQCIFVGSLLDSMTIFPLSIVVMFSMLQDRKRPLWPIGVMVAPLTAGLALCVIRGNNDFLPLLYTYLLLLAIALTIYIIRAVRQYGQWLRDNYADLEHKEVWQSFLLLATILLFFTIYACDVSGSAYRYLIQVGEIVVICFLLWRVETLSDLSAQQHLATEEEVAVVGGAETTEMPKDCKDDMPNTTTHDNITPLLQEHCINAQLYLQHELTLQQLAKAVGINRYYLSQYFSARGTTYNAYINGLRITHFVNLYREAVATKSPFTTKQLAYDSGYRSYSTFSLAFKQRMGQNVTEWMRDSVE